MKFNVRTIATLLVSMACAAVAADDSVPLTFERHVRPILKAKCFQCHGEHQKTEGELDLRLRRFIVAGGESGSSIVPGNPNESYLLERVRLGEMPPGKDAEKLSADEIALVERWISNGAKTAREEPESIDDGFYITEEERQFWSFQPIRRYPIPVPENADRISTPVDAFLLAKLEENGATFSAEARKQMLVRRIYFDLIGLPPPAVVVDAYLADDSADAYERLVDRLLASTHYGERWGRHWLDIAGYADSDGAEGDKVRRFAYRYRDYVIRAMNYDKPFDEFICEQLAGDEVTGTINGSPTSDQAEKLIATGFLQMAPDATRGAKNRKAAHNQLVADTIKIVSTSLLGLSVGCARCHDHRFDPISQDDYYRFRAIFEPAFDTRVWQSQNRSIDYFTEADQKNVEAAYQQRLRGLVLRVVEQQLRKLPENRRDAAREAFETPAADRTEEQRKLVTDSGLNITLENIAKFDRSAPQELKRLKTRFDAQRKGNINTIRELGGSPTKTFLFYRGNPESPKHELQPGELTILQSDTSSNIPSNDPALRSSGRRLAYAQRLTDGTHPLLARVIVNRVWMHHFGQGLCATPTDFGLEGDKPSHPELLDWLASEFMDSGWSLKKLHKLIVTSTAYRQGPRRDETLIRADPHNRLFGGFPIRRLEAEIVRDAVLAVSGKLNRKAFGAAVPVMMDAAGENVIGVENQNAGVPLAIVPMFGEEHRRSVYVQARRTMPVTFMQMFDTPDMEPNCEARTVTTVAPQSLVLMNSPFMLRQSISFAERVRTEAGNDTKQQVEHAWKLAFSRAPSSDELADAVAFLDERTEHFRMHPPVPTKRADVPGSRSRDTGPQAFDVLIRIASKSDAETLALALLCQMLMSSNEFLYVG